MNTAKLSEDLDQDVAIAYQDVGTADITSAYYPAANYRRFWAKVKSEALLTGKILTAQLMQATSSVGAGAKALGTLVTTTSVGSGTSPDTGQVLEADAEANAAELDSANGFVFVAVKIGSDVNGKKASAIFNRGSGRFGPGAA